MSHSSCSELLQEAIRYSDEDLIEIGRASLKDLLTDFDRIITNYRTFKKDCFSKLDSSLYEYCVGRFNIALLKLCVAIEDKVSGTIVDDRVRQIINMFTEDEKRLIRDLERFNSLDRGPEVLKGYIISKHRGIYELIKEAVDKQYTNFDKLIESWSNTFRISDYVKTGFLTLYRRRFWNVMEAIRMLLSEEPAWIRRLFREYEDALLSSSELRKAFEERAKEIFEEKARSLSEHVERLENEKKALMEKIDELSKKSYAAEVEKKVAVENLMMLQKELHILGSSYEKILRNWEAHLKELESYREKLSEKEKELQEIKEKERENAAAKEALELEILRLKQLVDSYESKLREYEMEKSRLHLELRSAEERISEIEKAIKGEVKGREIPIEEVEILHRLFINKLRDKLSTQTVTLRTPWGTETVSKWSDVKVYFEGDPDIPRTVRAIFTYEKKALLGLGERRKIVIVGISVLSDEEVKKRGFAFVQASLTDLNRILREISAYTEESRTFTLVAISSPTGWDERALKYVTGESSLSLVTTEQVVMLVDPVENKVYYPEELARTAHHIEEYARLFTLETSVEEEHRIAKIMKDLCDEAKAKSPFEAAFPYRLVNERVKLTSWLSLVRVMHMLREKRLIEFRKDKDELLVLCRGTW